MTLRDLLNASCRHDRYARNDELGVPFAVTFDFETMEAGPGGREMHDLVVWLLKEATMLLKVLEGFGFISDAYPLKFQHCNSLCTYCSLDDNLQYHAVMQYLLYLCISHLEPCCVSSCKPERFLSGAQL